VKYWESILELLSRLIRWKRFILLEGFWPSNNWKINYERASIRIVVDVDPEDPVIPPYYGPKRMCPSLSTTAYMPFRDLFTSNFVLV
jgi:hypothetical protein